MMAVMAFEAQRRDRLVSQDELERYTHHLAVAVTEHLHYFIGHGSRSPHDETRYAAATAAHIAHMLRDTQSDIEMGYFNVPVEVLGAAGIRPREVEHPAVRAWVRERVEFAREQFRLAHDYLSRVESWRVRLAGHSYMSRFVSILKLIERDQYLLRMNYPKRRTLSGLMTFLGSLHASLFADVPNPVPTYRDEQ
jgi:phytoene/squalene synthetase